MMKLEFITIKQQQALTLVLSLLLISTTTKAAFTTKTINNAAAAASQQVLPAALTTTTWHLNFTPSNITIHMDETLPVQLELTNIDTPTQNYVFHVKSEDEHLAYVGEYMIPGQHIDPVSGSWKGNISIVGKFLGQTQIYVERVSTLTNSSIDRNSKVLKVIIIRQTRVIDHIFIGSVALLVSLLYINFGAALDVTVLRGLVRRPTGPIIGLLTQFVVMPVLSYVLGLLLFPHAVEMQLGLFFTGVSPAGGASNIWTVILGGNINLSVLMTTVGNFAAFVTMPFWLFTLGQYIFERAKMSVPYAKIATLAVSLVVPLGIGLCIQKWSPRLTRVLVRLLKPISMCLILFIIVFAIITNFYIFELFSWQIAVAGLTLPWLGYILAFIAAKALRQNSPDALTIAIETGIQNTGIAIFLLSFALPQPQADLTTVIPVSVAIMTPFPLLGLYIYKRCTERGIKAGVTEESQILPTPHNS